MGEIYVKTNGLKYAERLTAAALILSVAYMKLKINERHYHGHHLSMMDSIDSCGRMSSSAEVMKLKCNAYSRDIWRDKEW